MDYPPHFRCPISMEVMKDPVTISTGVTYERRNIEKWFFTYKMKTCPATMQTLHDFHLTPNITLKRLILAWQHDECQPPPPSVEHDELTSLIHIIDSSPFKLRSLRKLRSVINTGGDAIKILFMQCQGVAVLVQIVLQGLIDSFDFDAFRACEEALGVLHHLPVSENQEMFQLLSEADSMKSISLVLQKGGAEARYYAVTIFKKMAKADYDCNWELVMNEHQGVDFFKSLLELVSDHIFTEASSSALEVLIKILGEPKKTVQLKAIEAGAVSILIELLPESNRSKSEKILLIIKLLCQCPEGRSGFVEHGLGIAAVTKKLLRVSDIATKIGVKIFWLICKFHPTEWVLDEMLVSGSVRKLLGLLHMDRTSSTKQKVFMILKLHGNTWRRNYTCFPCELKDYLGRLN